MGPSKTCSKHACSLKLNLPSRNPKTVGIRYETATLQGFLQHTIIYYTIYYILYTIYYILYTIYYILYTIYYILYTIYYILYTIYYILYTIYYILYTIYYILYTIYYILYTIYYILYTIYYILYTVYYILYTMHYILYTIYSILYTLYYTIYNTLYYPTLYSIETSRRKPWEFPPQSPAKPGTRCHLHAVALGSKDQTSLRKQEQNLERGF